MPNLQAEVKARKRRADAFTESETLAAVPTAVAEQTALPSSISNGAKHSLEHR